MIRTLTYKKLKDETETVMSYGDVLNIIEENIGSEVVNALLDFQVEENSSDGPNMITYIEDGIFAGQIEESKLINRIADVIITNLDKQGYIRKNRNINNFEVPEDELVQIVDEKLSPGMMNYFDK